MKNLLFITVVLLTVFETKAQIELANSSLDSLIRYNLDLEIDDVISLEKALSLTHLEASSLSIEDLEGLSSFKNLKIINFSNNEISDVSEIALLPNLKFVSLSSNQITSILPLLVCNSENVKIDVSQNCIEDIDIIKSNMINPITFIGDENQKDDCASQSTMLLQFEVLSTDINTKEVRFLYRGYHPTMQEGMIDFGNSEDTTLTLDGSMQELIYNYSENNNYTAELTLNEEILSINVSLAISPLILKLPVDKESKEIDVWVNDVFNWEGVTGAKKYEISILKDSIEIAGRITDGTQLDFDVFSFESSGEYDWRVRASDSTSKGPWSNTFSFTIIKTLGISDLTSNDIMVHPNPVKDFLIVNTDNVERIELYNLRGEMIGSYSVKNIDLRSFDSGMYILKVTDGEHRVKSMKIVKE